MSKRKALQGSPYLYIEIHINSGSIAWSNSVLTKLSASSGTQILESSIHSHVHDDFKSRLTDCLSKIRDGYSIRKSMWPILRGSHTVWFGATIDAVLDEYVFVRLDLLHRTEGGSPEYNLAKLIAECRLTISEVEISLSSASEDLQSDMKSMQRDLREVEKDLELTAAAARLSAEAAVASRLATEEVQKDIKTAFARHTEEVTRLVTGDVMHDRRLKLFEEAVEQKTREAIEKIESRVSDTKSLGKGLAIPVGTATAVTALAQWVFEHFLK